METTPLIIFRSERRYKMRYFTKYLAIALILFLFVVGILIAARTANAEDELREMYVICQPDDFIYIRLHPSRKSEVAGYLMPGETVTISNKVKNGYAYCPNLSNEAGEGWVYTGYLTEDEPEHLDGEGYCIISKARVACRKCINGDRLKWLHNGDHLKVWYKTEEWSVTNRGFVMTKYLEEDP